MHVVPLTDKYDVRHLFKMIKPDPLSNDLYKMLVVIISKTNLEQVVPISFIPRRNILSVVRFT